MLVPLSLSHTSRGDNLDTDKTSYESLFTQAVFNNREVRAAARDKGIYNEFLSQNEIKLQYPWLFKNFYKESHKNSQDGLHKWIGDINISLGYPNNLNPYGRTDGSSTQKYALHIPDYISNLSKQEIEDISLLISTASIKLSKLTGLKINYVDPSKETAESYGNLRVVFVKDTISWETPYKKGNVQSGMSAFGGPEPILFRENIERSLENLTSFTPSINNQVDGYFLSKESGEIYFGTCYIWHGHTRNVRDALLHECLTRSLGIPGLISTQKRSLFTNWTNEVGGRNREPILGEALDEKIIKELYRPSLSVGSKKSDIAAILKSQNQLSE